ncbi:MAG: hypothetical protein IJZ88_06990 [Clostridia bacterium]|nr:hypothetical protein [Clostridia bacterium]
MKKDKNASQDVMPKKDYQQEFDPDVKKSSKSKKAVIAVSAFIALFFLVLLVWYISDNSVKEEHYDVEGETAAAVVQQGQESSDEVIAVKDSLLDLSGETVEITVPLAYYQGNVPADTLSDEQLASGYVAVKKDDVNVVYTVKTSFYPSMVENLYEYNETKGNEYEKKNGVELVSFNKGGNLFTVTVNKSGYKANAHYDMLEDLYYNASIYQCYLGVTNPSVDFQMKYLREQFPFADYQFPNSLGKDLSVIAADKPTTTTAATEAQ